jgi:sugar/nucleoside kinase (ribokinase family)
VDPAGAGDAFCGTFASGIDAGLDPFEALTMASAAGALVCLGIGAQAPLADRGEVLRFAGSIEPIRRIASPAALAGD